MRASEVIAALETKLSLVTAERDAAVAQLQAIGIEPVAVPQALMGLTAQERAYVVLLYEAYPRHLNKWDLLERLPAKDHAVEREARIVYVLAYKIRGKLKDKSSVENLNGIGYRLGKSMYEQLSGEIT